jgi:hypothetical protein
MRCKMQGLILRDFVRRYVVFVLVSECCGGVVWCFFLLAVCV